MYVYMYMYIYLCIYIYVYMDIYKHMIYVHTNNICIHM